MNWSMKHIQDLKAAGKIRGYTEPKKTPESEVGGKKIVKHWKLKSVAKDWIGFNLVIWCQQHSWNLEGEYKFHPQRKWRFDWAIPGMKVAIEFEGGIHDRNGSHTSVKDIMRDTEKYNAAASLSWRVLRFNARNYKTLISELNKLIS